MSAPERKGRLQWRTARLIRPVLAVLLAAIVLVIGIYIVRRIGQTPPPLPEKKDIVEKKVDRKENVRVSQTHREKGLIEASGALNSPLDDKTYRLTGGVEITDHGRKGGREIKMNGDVLTYDKDMTHFVLQGNVRIRYRDVVMNGPDFEYDRMGDVIKTSNGAEIATSKFGGTAQKLMFFVKDEELILEENLRFSLKLDLPSPDPLVISGQRLSYGFLRRRGDFEAAKPDGRIEFSHGKSRGAADHVYMEQWEAVDDLRILLFTGKARIEVEEERTDAAKINAASPAAAAASPGAQETSIDREFKLDQSVRQVIESDEIKFQAFLNLPNLRLIECRGRSMVRFLFASGEATQFRGGDLDMNFSQKGGLREIRVYPQASVSSLDKAGETGSVIEGASITLDAEKKVVRVASAAGRKARIVSGRSDVSGNDLTIQVEENDFEMKGDARLSFRPSPKEAADTGFFSTASPVFANAGGVRYMSRLKRFLLWDQVRTWQAQRVLTAQEITLTEDMTEMACRGGVRSVFPHKAKEGEPERRVELAADAMRYDSAARQLIYEGTCVLRSGAAVLQCGLIKVDPGEAGGEIRFLHATKGASKAVSIVMNLREGTGELAEYDVQKDTITLTGRPELKEKDKGTVKGDKLTFHLTDATIRVESRDQERPAPVIKS